MTIMLFTWITVTVLLFAPMLQVISSINGSRVVRAHGTCNMPVWGEVFRQEHEKEKYTELTSLLKAKLIAEYVGTLQK